MEKEFVTYNQALRLKELGFDEPCFGYYSEGKFIPSSHTNNHMQRFRYAAPTFSQAFRWFREKYGLYDTISKNGYMIEGEINGEFLRITILSLKSHEEAELACLDKLIEIVEPKEK